MTNIRVGYGFDVHRLVQGRDLWIGGIKIDHTLGLLGHSDADVLIHAICDALLGAATLRDIGFNFPDTDMQYKNIDSKILLKRTVDLLASKGWSVVNVDATICAERPKLNPHIPEMQQVMAQVMGIDPDRVSIKDRTENKIHFVLLGDPALRLAVAELKAVVDSFNGADTTVTGAAKAGSVVTVSGHIECNGERVTDYRGILSSTVFDNERLITCRDNQHLADEPFTFRYRDRILYSGTDSVRNGEFRFSFPVPLDINYSNQNGQILLYAKGNDGLSANGVYDNFTVGGTADGLSNDSVGPEINLYLNTPTFQYGASVNATPTLVAELRDTSGLNTSGNGLGHDILLVIDNNPNWTWVLNSLFENAEGDYTAGRVMFTLPELPEGKHELMLRAWDVMNNSTTVYLGFKVVNDLKPKFSIDVTASPARENTSFVITHDRPGQNASVTIQVSSTDGMLQWSKTCRDESGSGVTVVDWNLHGNSGHRMQPGLYIVRAIVGTDGGGSSSASCKLVIVGR